MGDRRLMTTTVTSAGEEPWLPSYPMRRDDPVMPPTAYRALRASAPVARVRFTDGRPIWLVTRYDLARTVLTGEAFSGDSSRPGFPRMGPGATNPRVRTFTRMDPPEHDRLRRMVSAAFTVKGVEGWREMARETSRSLVDAMLATRREADLVQCFALPLTSTVISRLLGVPYEDHEFFETRTRGAVSIDPEEVERATDELLAYLDDLVTRQTREPADGLLGRLVVEQLRPGHLGHDDLVRMARQLLSAGHETTANMIALSTLTLLRSPRSAALVRERPALMRNAVEELLRFHTIQTAVPRVAIADTELAGVRVAADDGILVALPACNHDPQAFPGDPEAVDVERQVRHHLAFGFGVHQCLGQNLARVELEVALSELFGRLRGLELAVPEAELRYKHDRIIYGLEALPLRWGEPGHLDNGVVHHDRRLDRHGRPRV